MATATVRVASGGKLQAYVARALEALPVRAPAPFAPAPRPADPLALFMQATPVVIAAEGAAVGKAVTVAEIAKRRLRGLHQNTQIGLAGADGERSTPRIAITLSCAPLDPTLPG